MTIVPTKRGRRRIGNLYNTFTEIRLKAESETSIGKMGRLVPSSTSKRRSLVLVQGNVHHNRPALTSTKQTQGESTGSRSTESSDATSHWKKPTDDYDSLEVIDLTGYDDSVSIPITGSPEAAKKRHDGCELGRLSHCSAQDSKSSAEEYVSVESTPNIPKKRKLEIRDALTTPFHKKLSQNETLEPPPSEMLPSPAKDVANPNDRPMGLHGPEINLLQRSRDCRYSSFAAGSMSSPETASLTTACALLGSESRTDPVSSISAMPSPPYNLPSFSAHSIYRLAATECIPGGKNHLKKTAVDRILTDPSMAQRHLLVLQQELKHNRDAFYQALQRRNVMERENLKKEKRHLLQQQAVWLSVARSLQSYKGLMLQRDALIERAVEAYDQSIDTKEYERLMGEIELKLSEQEYSLGLCLADAKIEDGSMTDGSKLQHPARMPWGAVE
ncbi:RecQ family ATP-dependent DNA helicase [Apiospora marii]|uniref:RecQ family ATP-dependent DNA helicase n=1 Tax=Apiospora marii TaxID=335849 RepID=UPI003130E6A0